MFWMVLGNGEPVHRHESLASARTEAARLAKQCPGHAFTVLESVATCQVHVLAWEELRGDANKAGTEECFPGWFLLKDADIFVKGDKIKFYFDTGDDPELWADVPECWFGKKVDAAVAARSYRPF